MEDQPAAQEALDAEDAAEVDPVPEGAAGEEEQ